MGNNAMTTKEKSVVEEKLANRGKILHSAYQSVSLQFVDHQDTPGRMLAKDCIQGIVPWTRWRSFLYYRLKLRLLEEAFVKASQDHVQDLSRQNSLEVVRKLYNNGASADSNDESLVNYLS